MAPALPRPRQVSVAGWMIVACSVGVVLTVFQQIAGLQSLDTRESLQEVLGQPPFDGLGLSVDELVSVIRVASMVAAACATATAILGWQALQRSRSARVALSILALPLFVTGLGSGAVLSTAVAVGVVLLWLQPARDWFDGRWKPVADEPRRTPEPRPAPRETAPVPPQASQPPPYAAWPPRPDAPAAPQAPWPPQVPQQPWPPQQPYAAPTQQPPYRPGRVAGAPSTARRPGAVVAAVVLTWVCSVLLGGLFVAGALWLLGSPDTLMDEMTRQNPELVRDGTLTVGLVRTTLAVMAGVIAVWVVAACVTAFFVLRGAAWARVLLLVSAGVAGAGLLVGSVVNPALLVPLVGAVTVFALLMRRDVGAWFAGRA